MLHSSKLAFVPIPTWLPSSPTIVLQTNNFGVNKSHAGHFCSWVIAERQSISTINPQRRKGSFIKCRWCNPEERCSEPRESVTSRVCETVEQNLTSFSNLDRQFKPWSRRIDKLLSGHPGNNASRRMTGVACTRFSSAVANQKKGLILDNCQTTTTTYGFFFRPISTQDIYQSRNAILHSWTSRSYSSLLR